MIVNITGVFYLPSGVVAASRLVAFKPIDRSVRAGYLGGFVPDPVIIQTGIDGSVDFNLLTGSYFVTIEAKDTDNIGRGLIFAGKANVPDAPSASISAILDAAVAPDVPPVWYTQAIQAAEDAIDASVAAQAWAESPTPPGDPGTKSAKTWAVEAAASAELSSAFVAGINEASFESLQLAIDAALADGVSEIAVNRDLGVPVSGTNRSNVIFVGSGSLLGTNTDSPAYRRPVVPANALSARAMPDRWMLADHWKREPTVRVVVVGDSLTTYGANALTAQDGMTLHLERVLRRSNPDRNIEVTSRGIGGQRFTDIDTVQSVSYPVSDRYPWYDDDQRPWLDYVADLEPHIVVLASGMNDQAAFDRAAFESVVAKVNAMASKPKIVICTNMAPNLAPHPSYEQYGSYAGQEGRDYVAGYLRTYADYHGYSLIDIHRTFGIVRDGRDILDTYFEEIPTETFETPSVYVAPASAACRDFTLRATIAAGAWTNAQPFAVKTSPNSTGAVFIDSPAGFLRFRFYRGGTSSNYVNITSQIPTPATDADVEITLRGSLFSFRLIPTAAGADAGAHPFTASVIRHGGLFRPDLRYFSGGGTGPVLSAKLGVGKERLYVPAITDLELWGVPSASSGSDRPVTGGNGINHPASKGASAIYGMHFAVQSYPLPRIAPYQVGELFMARLDGNDNLGTYQTVAGERITPANASGAAAGTWPTALTGTTWEALGSVSGTTDAERTVIWRRVS